MVCGECSKRGITAKGVADAGKRRERELTCAACSLKFPRQGHISSAQEADHLKRGVKVVCADCKDLGFTARSWQAYQCNGTCKRNLPKSSFCVRPDNIARVEKKGTLKRKACK